MIKVLILTEGRREIGFGHVTRCTALYQAFEERGIPAELIVEGDESVVGLLHGKQYRILSWRSDRSKLSSLMTGAEIMVVDSYLAEKGSTRRSRSGRNAPFSSTILSGSTILKGWW